MFPDRGVPARSCGDDVSHPRAHHGACWCGVSGVHRGRPLVHGFSTPMSGLPTPIGGPYAPQAPTVRVGGPWSKPSTTAAPGRLRAAPHAPRAARGSRRTTSRPRSPCSERCCCRTTPRRSGSRCVRAGDFYKPAHGHIFGAIRALVERGEAIDAVTVTDELKRSGAARRGRRPVDLHLAAGQHAVDRQRPALRRDRRGALAAAQAHRRGRGDRRHRLLGPRGRQGGGRRRRAARLQRGRAAGGRHHVPAARTAGTGPGPHRGARTSAARTSPGVATGYHELDRLLLGCQPSTLNIVGARPGHGQDQLRPGGAGPRGHGGRSGRRCSSRSRWATSS